MNSNRKATLILEDGSQFTGNSFGVNKNVAGEIVFNTAMVGYPEILTDPTYSEQFVLFTYPLIGNYGIPNKKEKDGITDFLESEKIHTTAIIVNDYSNECSHWNAKTNLSDWLIEENIVGISDVDTRAITKLLREKGTMKAKIVFDNSDVDFIDSNTINQVENVSCKNVITYNEDKDRRKVVLIDCGIKHSIIRNLIARNLTIIRVPWDYDYSGMEFDGIFISNGPGNPDFCDITIHNIKKNLNNNKPICGIGIGNLLLAKAAGSKTYKLKYGHRGNNQPVRMINTNNCFITLQNHGYAVDDSTLCSDWETLFVNMNDGTNEGIKHKNKPFFASQFYFETISNYANNDIIFDMFIQSIRQS